MPFFFEFPDYSKREACVDAAPSKRTGKCVRLTAAELGEGATEDLDVYLTREGNTVRVLNVLGTNLGGFPRQIADGTRKAIITFLGPGIYTLLPEPEDVISRGPDGKIDQIDL